MYEYRCKIKNVVDGDTIDIDIDLGFDHWLVNQRIRLDGVDTPECRTRNLTEKRFGLMAKKVVQDLCPVGSDATLISKDYDKGKFGRILGVIYDSDGINVNQFLTDNHYAVSYHGQSKKSVKIAHETNFILLDKL